MQRKSTHCTTWKRLSYISQQQWDTVDPGKCTLDANWKQTALNPCCGRWFEIKWVMTLSPMMYDSHLHQTVQLVISARKKHQKFLRHRWRIIHYGKYMFDLATLHEGPAMTGICLPSPTISISTFSHTMQDRRHPSRAIQRLQGEKRYRPLEIQHEPPNIGWFISGCCVVSHQDYTVWTIVDKKHPAKNWDTKNANVVSTHFLWETIGSFLTCKE